MGEPVIETHNLGKRYGSAVAVDALDLSVRKGEVFGLLGPNGSGKTTTILMLLGLTEPTSGSVRVLGLDPARRPLSVKARVGYMPDEVGFYDELSARSNLAYIARLNGLTRDVAGRRIASALERAGLAATADQPVKTFSRGMRQRLGVADVLLKEPQLIIMDEPTQGLDPEGARAFLRTVHDLQEEGITFLISSHLLYQVQVVCDRVGLFRLGRMELEGTVADLAQRVLGSGYHILVQAEGAAPELRAALERVPGTVDVQGNGDGCYRVAASRDARPEVAQAVVSAGGRLLSLSMEAPSLDDIYGRYFEEVEHGGQD